MGPELASTWKDGSDKSSVSRPIQIIVISVSRNLHFLNCIIATLLWKFGLELNKKTNDSNTP